MTDSCPRCVARGNQPVATTTTRDGIRCAYRCHTCGHRWFTSYIC